MESFAVVRTGDIIQVSFPASTLDERATTQLLNRLFLEFLSRKINFGEEIEQLGKEIKRKWWVKNKARIQSKIHAENGSH